jgi:hypothetical protein
MARCHSAHHIFIALYWVESRKRSTVTRPVSERSRDGAWQVGFPHKPVLSFRTTLEESVP